MVSKRYLAMILAVQFGYIDVLVLGKICNNNLSSNNEGRKLSVY